MQNWQGRTHANLFNYKGTTGLWHILYSLNLKLTILFERVGIDDICLCNVLRNALSDYLSFDILFQKTNKTSSSLLHNSTVVTNIGAKRPQPNVALQNIASSHYVRTTSASESSLCVADSVFLSHANITCNDPCSFLQEQTRCKFVFNIYWLPGMFYTKQVIQTFSIHIYTFAFDIFTP